MIAAIWKSVQKALKEALIFFLYLAKRSLLFYGHGKKKRFLVLVDYCNIEEVLLRDIAVVDLVEKIVKDNIIEWAFVFSPAPYVNSGTLKVFERKRIHTLVPLSARLKEEKSGNGKLQQVANLSGYAIVPCPNNSNGTGEVKDMVDEILIDVGKSHIRVPYITDVVIVSGDGHFADFANYARHQGKRVTVVSSERKLNPFLEEAANEVYVIRREGMDQINFQKADKSKNFLKISTD